MRNAHVLIVDDEPELVDALALRLRAAGYRVSSAGDGLAAVEAALAERPDLVLLDLVLPTEDGHAVLRRLRSLGGDVPVPVICLTARTDPAARQRALAAGAADFLTKPFDGRRLLAAVADRLAGVAAPDPGPCGVDAVDPVAPEPVAVL